MSGRAVLTFFDILPRLEAPQQVIDELHRRVAVEAGLSVLGAWLVPFDRDPTRYVLGRNIFLHASVPRAFLADWTQDAKGNGMSATQQLAYRSFAGPFTFTEAMRGADGGSWVFDVLRRHGMRDGLYCPVGRWMVVYWSPKVLKLKNEVRGYLCFAATQAAFKLADLVPVRMRDPNTPNLSKQQRRVLTLIAEGYTVKEAARIMKLTENSAQDHWDRARHKLGAKNGPNAVWIASRNMMIG